MSGLTMVARALSAVMVVTTSAPRTASAALAHTASFSHCCAGWPPACAVARGSTSNRRSFRDAQAVLEGQRLELALRAALPISAITVRLPGARQRLGRDQAGGGRCAVRWSG